MKVRFVKPEQKDPARDRGITVPYAPAKRNLARWRWYIILLVVSSPLLYFVTKFAYSSVVVEAPGFVRQEQITVRAMVAGYVSDVYVKPLQVVAEGTPIARIGNPDLQLRAAQLRAELKELGQVSGKEVDNSPPSTTGYQDQIEIYRQQRDEAAQRMDNLQQLVNQGAATEAELGAARNQFHEAEGKVAQTYQAMSIQSQPNSSGAQVRTSVAQARSELASVSQQMDGLLVRAPHAGRIVDLPVIKGDQLAIGGKLAMLAPNGAQMHIAAYIPPEHTDYAAPGQQATVLFPDGMRRVARVTDVPEVMQQVPTAGDVFASQEQGVLVRMEFADGDDDTAEKKSLTDGLPVRVRFQNQWKVGLELHRAWDGVRDQLKQWRSRNESA